MKLRIAVFLVLVAGCTSNRESFTKFFEFGGNQDGKLIQDYTSAKQEIPSTNGKIIEYFSCLPTRDRGSVLVTNFDNKSFTKNFCTSWMAQTIMQHRFGVVGVNLPGYGNSGGPNDHGGKEAQAALFQVGRATKAIGAWSSGIDSIGLAMAAKGLGLSWIVIGNGVFDSEYLVESSGNIRVKEIFEKIAKSDPSGIEVRSVAWDFEGFPKSVFIYHSEKNTTVELGQAKAFKEALSLSEHQVELQVVPEVTENMDSTLHRQVLESILARIAD